MENWSNIGSRPSRLGIFGPNKPTVQNVSKGFRFDIPLQQVVPVGVSFWLLKGTGRWRKELLEQKLQSELGKAAKLFCSLGGDFEWLCNSFVEGWSQLFLEVFGMFLVMFVKQRTVRAPLVPLF